MLRSDCGNIKCKIPYDIDNFKESPIVSEEHFTHAPWLSYYYFNTMPYIREDII